MKYATSRLAVCVTIHFREIAFKLIEDDCGIAWAVKHMLFALP